MAAGDFHKSSRSHKLSETAQQTLVRVRVLTFNPPWSARVLGVTGWGHGEGEGGGFGKGAEIDPCLPRRGFIRIHYDGRKRSGCELRCFGTICGLGIHEAHPCISHTARQFPCMASLLITIRRVNTMVQDTILEQFCQRRHVPAPVPNQTASIFPYHRYHLYA